MLHEEVNERTSVGAECLGQIRERVIVDRRRDKRVDVTIERGGNCGIEAERAREATPLSPMPRTQPSAGQSFNSDPHLQSAFRQMCRPMSTSPHLGHLFGLTCRSW